MSRAGFELTIPVFEKYKITSTLDHVSTAIGRNRIVGLKVIEARESIIVA
jgi:hypothetical protein